MDYPSTTQALFALVVMIIVLVFIMVYCCWGTLTCPNPETQQPCSDDVHPTHSTDRTSTQEPRAVVILPYHNLIYVGDSLRQQVLQQLPATEDKPPSYNDLFIDIPPPEYKQLFQSEDPPNYEQCTKLNLKSQRSTREDSQMLVLSPGLLKAPVPSTTHRNNTTERINQSVLLPMGKIIKTLTAMPQESSGGPSTTRNAITNANTCVASSPSSAHRSSSLSAESPIAEDSTLNPSTSNCADSQCTAIDTNNYR